MSNYQNSYHRNYTSPLEELLSKLRRKYVAAAGPQLHGFGRDSTSQIYGTNDLSNLDFNSPLFPTDFEEGDGMEQKTNNEEERNMERIERRRSSMMMVRTSSMHFSRRRSSIAHHRSSISSLGSNIGNLSPRTTSKVGHRGSMSNFSTAGSLIDSGVITVHGSVNSGTMPNSSFLDQKTAFLECTTRYRSGISSTCHAENLFACAPHLRHMTQSSADMLSSGSSSRNPIAAFVNELTRSGEATSESKDGTGTLISDYRSSLNRKHTNTAVARELATFVRVLANEMPHEEFAAVEAEIFSDILKFMHSSDCNKRLAGIAALDALIGVTSADEEKKITKFSKNLNDSLFKASNVDYEFLAEVTKALGKMTFGGTNVDYIETVIKRVPEWLKRDRSDRRLAAVLTVKELAQNAPATFYSKTNQLSIGKEGDTNDMVSQLSILSQEGGTNAFISQIFPVLLDPQPIVRVCAADTLAECLEVIVDPSRKHHSTTRTLCKVYSFIMKVFNEKNTSKKRNHHDNAKIEAAQHAALLVIGDLLELPLDFMLPRFDEACKAALSLMNHPKALIQVEVIRLLPRLARKCPGPFRRRYLETSLEYIMYSAKSLPTARSSIDLRPTAYFALGQLILAVCEHESGGCFVPEKTLQFYNVDNERGGSFNTNVTETSYRMKAGDIYSNMSDIFSLICEGMQTVKIEALHCGADVIEALGSYSESFIDETLDAMFLSGLSDDLISCLKSIAGSLPSKAYEIENRLLQELSTILAGTTHVKDICDPLYASPFDNDDDTDVFISYNQRLSPNVSINLRGNPETIQKLLLSLRTLRSFGNIQSRKGLSLLPFVRDAVAQYLSHPSVDVRREAALTCCFLLLPVRDEETSSVTSAPRLGTVSMLLLEEVLQKLLRVAVSDSSFIIRNCIIRAFDERYDPYLCQTHLLPPLFLLMQDESLVVKAATLELLGRLASINPGPLLPEMRRVLIQLISELKCSGDTNCGKEAATRLLIVFFRANALHRLVHPFLHSIIEVLPLKGHAPRVTVAALDALGELASVVKEELKPWMHQLLPHIMEIIQDSSSSNKQKTGFRTLGLLAGNTGCVIDLYLDYPRLLSQASSILPRVRRAPWDLRQEVIRTYGILGALDPDRFVTRDSSVRKTSSGYFVNPDESNVDIEKVRYNRGQNLLSLPAASGISFPVSRRIGFSTVDNRFEKSQMSESKETSQKREEISEDKSDDDDPAHLYMYELYTMNAQPVSKISPAPRLTPAHPEFYATVALQALTSILKDPTLSVYHQIAMQAIMFIFDSLGLRCVQFLRGIVPHILYTARACGQATLREALLKQIARLSSIVKDNLKPYVPGIFEVIEEFWDSQHLKTILKLIEMIAVGVPSAFKQYISLIISKFLANLNEFQSGSWTKSPQSANEAFNRLHLILESIRNLRESIVAYTHVIIPALLKLVDSVINPSMHFGIRNEKCSTLAIYTIKTVSLLLRTNTTNALKGQGEQMPALAAQPLIRMLAANTEANKEVGILLIEAIKVCAVKIGKSRWLPLYHLSARNAIFEWHKKYYTFTSEEEEQNAIAARKHNCLREYDELIQGFVSMRKLDELSLTERLDKDIQQKGINSSKHHLQINDLAPVPQSKVQQLSQLNLSRSWDVSQKQTREDWDEWMRHFAIQLLRESPSTALRATAELAYAYQPLARELFSAAFSCCWASLDEEYRMGLIQALKTAFFADISPEILQTLLNLAEFAERDGIPGGGLPIEIDVLAELALKCRSYAKALHYKEREHAQGGKGNCIEDLITINRKLDLPEAALGVLKAAQSELEKSGTKSWDMLYRKSIMNKKRTEFSSRIFHRHQGEGLAYSVMSTADEIAAKGTGAWSGVEMQESWLAKLGSWADALALFESRLEENPSDIEAVLGCMNCLDARGEWKKVLELSNRSFHALTAGDTSYREYRKATNFCAQASWRLGKWDDLEKYSSSLLEDRFDIFPGASRPDFDGSFFSAILNIHRKRWNLAAKFIDDARQSMDSRFTALMSESRKRAYPSMVTAQILSEMEEIISFRKLEERSLDSVDKHIANKEDVEDARARLVDVWRKRLEGCRVDAEVHSSIIAVRSLVLGPMDEVEATLTLSNLSRQAQKYKLSERVLLEPLEQLGADLQSVLFGFEIPSNLSLGLLKSRHAPLVNSTFPLKDIVSSDAGFFLPLYNSQHQSFSKHLAQIAGGVTSLRTQHRLYYAYVKNLWVMNNRDEALHRLEKLADIVDLVAHTLDPKSKDLRVSCWLKLGEWKISSKNSHIFSLPKHTQYEALVSFKRATYENVNCYKAWHKWALMNFRLAQQQDENRHNILRNSNNRSVRLPQNGDCSLTLQSHVVAAVQGFVKATCLGTKRWSASVQQDLLNFLSCLFKYGHVHEVARVINLEIKEVHLEAWLGVLPQLLARIHIKDPSVRSILHSLLSRLGKKHPQALMYPLSVLVKSPVQERKDAAESLMNSLKKHSFALVEDALMVSSELIRVAILWLEQWHEGLEDASRLYFGEGNVAGMLDVLLPLHETLERGPSTKREQDFHLTFGRNLADAYTFVKEYIRLIEVDGGTIPTHGGFLNTGDNQVMINSSQKEEAENAMNAAWDLYYAVFRQINKQLPGLTTLELSHCSPALLNANNLELGVPGSYKVDGSFVKIDGFHSSVQVITSKQRPRKIVLRGGDGKDYVFLLKGHEDLRQDERVMQLFGLVNALLARDTRTNNHDLNIQRYTITPLSHNAGIVGWVPHCDTIHSLIRDYRQEKRIRLNMENFEMMRISQDYEQLTVMQKVEIFSEALDRTTGQGNDLQNVLWMRSTNSEEWLDRRTKFTRSIAVMSMVGYILGLGDRHPSNLMLDQISGRVLHIDFGDCFEVAMHREKFPEKIPFRLTRMLIKAMEVSGIEGSYRDTCERTMTVLRDNRDSLVAMLEAFVYDPLISWRLLGQSAADGRDDKQEDDLVRMNIASTAIEEEQSQDEDVSNTITNSVLSNVTNPRSDSNSFLQRRMAPSTNSNVTGSLHASQLRSFKIYSEMQSLSSNLNLSSRIASITGDESSRTLTTESLSRSRVEKSIRYREAMNLAGDGDDSATEEALNEKALKVIRRVQDKLSGTDFNPSSEDFDSLDVQNQVQKLIVQATSTENLCQLFVGWCAFW